MIRGWGARALFLRLLAQGLLAGLVLVPTLAGMLGVLAPAFGYFPALGFAEPSLAAFGRVLAAPGFAKSASMSLLVGLIGTALALFIAVSVTAGLAARPASRWIERLAAPAIAVPHLSIAVGAAFLVAPSGWLVRLVAAPLDWAVPPALVYGAGYDLAVLIAVLVLKEAPFLIAVLAAIARQLDDPRRVAIARSLGYGDFEARLKLLAPSWLARARLAVLAVLVYAIGNVELALLLGPSTPPLMPVFVLDLLTDPDLGRQLDGSAAALLLVALTGLAVLLWKLGSSAVAKGHGYWQTVGATPRLAGGMTRIGDGLTLLLVAFLLSSFAVLILWSLAGVWRFPQILPEQLDLDLWRARGAALFANAGGTALIAGLTAVIALAVVLFWLETRPTAKLPLWLWAPLVVPQIAFLFGLQVWLLVLGSAPGFWPVILAHLLFVVPYTALLLADSWAHHDPRPGLLARTLGHGPWTVFWRVTLPMLRGPVLLAFAIGFSVSVALYLPTLFAGGGRVATLATEALSLAMGGDRRFAAATGLILAVLPVTALLAARRLAR